MPQLSLTQKAYAVAKKNEGVTIAQVARELKFSHAAIKRAIERCEKSGSFERKKGTGRHEVLLPTSWLMWRLMLQRTPLEKSFTAST
ncbi:hypothetical protein INT47_003512 [Mucor saturninus]|uniref:Uncharacterized protein n=1 Tax=Mucor saturninus TaxID=64648 RepID=A0A8H7UTW8_9FUNG|nr:hypothetical protein INT47_003512 [Mucor saturninus]